MGVLDGGCYRQRGRAVLGLNLGHSIVTNEDFATQLFPNYFGQYLLSKVKVSVSQAVTYTGTADCDYLVNDAR